MDFLLELAKALFKAFGNAVSEYPFTTLSVLVAVFAFLRLMEVFVFIDLEKGRLRTDFQPPEIIYGLVGFIAAVVLANFVGYIFNAFTAAIGWIFGATEAFTHPA